MFHRIQYWLYRYHKKHLPVRSILFPTYNAIRSVVILYDQADYSGLQVLIHKMQRDGMIVEPVGYEPKKDFNILSRPIKQAFDSLPKQRCDLLMDLSTHYHLGVQYLDMAIDATFKAGLRFPDIPQEEQQGVLDLMVSLPHSSDNTDTQPYEAIEIAEQIIHFLKMINA